MNEIWRLKIRIQLSSKFGEEISEKLLEKIRQEAIYVLKNTKRTWIEPTLARTTYGEKGIPMLLCIARFCQDQLHKYVKQI